MRILALALAAALPLAAAAKTSAPEHVTLTELRVYPTNILLSTARDRQTVVAQAVYSDTVTRDVTDRLKWHFGRPELVRREGHVLHPAADGETLLTVSYGGRSVTLPVRVDQAAVEAPVSFKLDVMPVFMRTGCNSGACHGSARGQDGFRLSLFGYDPDGDYQRLTRELSGRRLNLARPEESLLIQKGLGAVPHTGGTLFARDSEYCETLLRWLNANAPADPTNLPAAVALEVLPDRLVLQGEGAVQQLTARVRYSDGSDRDVTRTAVFFSNNDRSARVSSNGLVTAGARGEAFVMARYAAFTVGAQAIVVPRGGSFVFPDVPAFNYIDEHVYAKLRRLRIAPSGLCTDAEFIRRASLDIAGRLPERAETEAFTADADPAKREKLVDRLLARKEFVEMWVMKWAELLQVRSRNNDFSYKAALLYYNWLQERVAANVPINRIARELLTGGGGTFSRPEANFYQVETDTLKLSENVAQVFMGARLQCAQCHNHPFDRWTMNDYYSYAAFFAQIGRKTGDDPRETVVFDRHEGRMEHPVTKQDMPPRYPGAGPADVKDRDRRAAFAEWLTAPDNPWFARNIANIVWAQYLGRGIVNPVDDVRVSNPAVNPDLLEALAGKLVAYDFDVRRLVRDICTSRTYQLSTQTNPSNAGDVANFAHAQVRRIRAEVLLDCISQVTETKNKFKGLPLGARAVQIADGNVSTYFLTAFGRATRETVCSCEVVMEPNLSQALHLLNGETTHQKVREGGVAKSLLAKGSPADALAELYLRCLARPPTAEEKAELCAMIEKAADKQQAVEDVFWSLLNAKEFVFNH